MSEEKMLENKIKIIKIKNKEKGNKESQKKNLK